MARNPALKTKHIEVHYDFLGEKVSSLRGKDADSKDGWIISKLIHGRQGSAKLKNSNNLGWLTKLVKRKGKFWAGENWDINSNF